MNISFINEKVFYRFVEFTSRLVSYDLCHEDYKLITLNKKEANTKIEKKVKRLSQSFLYLLNSTSLIIDLELIKTSYYLLTQRKMKKDISISILEHIYLHIDEPPHTLATRILMYTNTTSIARKLEYSLLMASFMLIRKGYYPIILHDSDRKWFKKLVRKHDFGKIYQLIFEKERYSREVLSNEVQQSAARDVMEYVEILKSEIENIKSMFMVDHLFLYGSVAKNTSHEYSDLDILVMFKSNIIGYERNKYIPKLKKYLESTLFIKLDILDFSYSLRNSETKEMNNTIKIF